MERETFINEVKKFSSEELVLKAASFVFEKWLERKINDKTHNLFHILSVLKNAFLIVKEERIKLIKEDKTNLILACLFHDLGLFFVKKPNDIEKSIELFKEFCEVNNCEIRETVINAIKQHSFSKDLERTNLISKILYDADKIDVLGFYGIYRAIVFPYNDKELLDLNKNYKKLVSLKKEEIKKLIAKGYFDDKKFVFDHYFTKMIFIPEKLHFDFSRKISLKLLERTKEFIVKTEEELKKSNY